MTLLAAHEPVGEQGANTDRGGSLVAVPDVHVLVGLRAVTAKTTPPPAPKVREVTDWIATQPGKVTAGDLAILQRINDRCPELASVTSLTREFAEMLVQLRGQGTNHAKTTVGIRDHVVNAQVRWGVPSGT